MSYRLLIALEAFDALLAAPKGLRGRLLDHFGRLRSAPEAYSDYQEHDAEGRLMDISVVAGWSIFYWIDAADRHIKVMALRPADG